jgi:hypothetical protein
MSVLRSYEMPTEPPTAEQLEEHLHTFGLRPGATLEEIKKRKSFLTRVMHEDVVAPQLKDQAREEMIRINAAWEVINAWFKANPDAKATPKNEGARATTGQQSQSPETGDDEDWETFEKNRARHWSGESISLAELDRKRRYDMIVTSRRNLIIKLKVAGGVLLALGGFTSLSPSNTAFDVWTLMLIAYLIWLFHPKAKAVTEKWIEKEQL